MTCRHNHKKPIILFVVWLITALIFTLFNKYGYMLGLELLLPTQKILSVAITVLITVLYFVPMLVVIYRQAKAVSLKWLIITARIFLIFFCCALPVFLIALLLALYE